MTDYKYIMIDKIELWKDNPRIMGENTNEDVVINGLFFDEELQKKLARDILSDGLLPNDLPILVEKNSEPGEYRSYEGNRRISIIKALNNPDILGFNKSLRSYFVKLAAENAVKISQLSKIYCLVTTVEEARKYIEKLHTSPQGISRKPWGSQEKEYFYDFELPEADHKKTPAYYIFSKYKDKFAGFSLDEIKYTSVNRLLGFQMIKDILGTKDYCTLTDTQIELIKFYFQKALVLAEEKRMFLSRFTVLLVRTNILEQLKALQNEILTRNEKYRFQYSEMVEVIKGSSFALDIRVFDKATEAEVSKEEISITYYKPTAEPIDSIDTTVCGTYTFSVNCHGENRSGSIIVRVPEKPNFSLKKNSVIIESEETIDLRNMIDNTDSRIISDNIKIENKMDSRAVITSEIFSKDNLPGKYAILYIYNFPDRSSITKTLTIEVIRPNYDRPHVVTEKSVFSNAIVYRSKINWAVSQIIQQIVDTDFNKSYMLIAAAYRAIVELSLFTLQSRFGYASSKYLDAKLKNYFDHLKANPRIIEPKCALESLSFSTYKNLIASYDDVKIEHLVSTLNLITHTSGSSVTKDSILNFGQTELTQLIILFYLSI